MSKKGDNIQKNQRIQVFARCRPLNTREKSKGSPSIVEIIPDKEVAVRDRNTRREFFFDKVFAPDSNQVTIYKSVVEPLIQEVLLGYNCTVFAYGQTGTGKTYTMEGERNNSECSWEEDPGAGIIPRSLHQLFEELNKGDNVEFCVRVSFLELYNEELFDLLGSTEFAKLRLYEDPIRKGSVIIQGLEEISVNSKDEVYTILERGTARRQTAATMLNATSSRSHTVFSVTVHIKENTVDGEELLKTGKLNLVDLAGSENVGRSGAVDKRAREAGNINQSLLTLGRVITALIEKQPHVPYRESKLTRLLQDSLGGHTKTSIIATISPAQLNLDETVSTLDYATKAKSITIRPEANQKMTKRALIREYTEEIERLKKDLNAVRSKEGFFIDADNYSKMLEEIAEKEDAVKQLQEKIDELKEKNEIIEQDIAIVKEKLVRKIQQCEITSVELERTSKELNNTKKVLSKTALERDETEHLLHAHCKTEKQLSQQAQTCKQLTEEYIDDVNKLHSKLERKQEIDEINTKCMTNFKRSHQESLANLNDIACEVESLPIVDTIQKILSQVFSGIKTFNQNYSNILQDITDTRDSLSKLTLRENALQQIAFTKSALDALKLKKVSFVTEQQSLFNELTPIVDNLRKLQTDIELLVSNNLDAVWKEVQQIRLTIEKESNRKLNLITTVRKNMDSFYGQHEVLLKELEEAKNYISSLEENSIESYNEQAELISSLQNSIKKQWENNQNILTKSKSKVQNIHGSMNDNLLELKNTYETVEDLKCLEKDPTVQKALHEVRNKFNINEFMSNQQMEKQEIESALTGYMNILQKDKEHAEFMTEEIESTFNCINQTVQDSMEINEEKLQRSNSTLSKIIHIEASTYEKRICEVENDIGSTEIAVQKLKGDLTHVAIQLKEGIHHVDLEFEKFIYEDLQKDKPTGFTPQRKNYEERIPKEFAVTSPHEKILQRIRLKCEGNTHLAVNMPLESSFDENDEFKSPITQDYTEPVISSSNSDEEYLTGCETDSNASSMSDISIDSSKNKENWKCIPKRSHLPKPKKLKSESVGSTTVKRKPLLPKNPLPAN